MLNTIMALWNQNPGESRQKIVKVVFTILFISGSASLFLFTLNSSAWSPFAGAQEQRTKKADQPTMSDSRGIVIAGNTPVSAIGTAGVTPTTTTSNKKVIMQPSCVQAPAVIAPQRATTSPQNVAVYSGKNVLGKRSSERRHVHPKAVLVKKGKPHSAKRPEVKVIAPPVSQPTETVPVAPPMLPVAPSIARPTAAPVATADVIATTTPADGTVVSNVPAVVMTGATPDISATSTAQFASSLRQKGALRGASASPLVKGGQKSADKKDDHVHGNVACSGSTPHRVSSGRTTMEVERRSGLLLGGSLLGMLLSYCFAFVFRRGE